MVKVEIIDKPKDDVLLPQGAAYGSPGLMALYNKMFGGFDYAYTQLLGDNSTFTMSYLSREKEDGKGAKQSFLNFVSRTVGEKDYIKDKFPFKTESTWLSYHPAKPGYVVIMEYFKKEKRLDVHMEQVNY